MDICFVTPAWRRYSLTAVCLEQRSRVIDYLARKGISAQCVVIADDANLETARHLGFATVETPNDWLDTKFNDGMEYAGRNGAEWIVPIGSDSWIDPAYFLPLPSPTVTRTSPYYSVVEMHRMAELAVGKDWGAGPYMFHRSLLEPTGFRPAGDGLRHKGIDGATLTGIGPERINWQQRNLDFMQYVGFRGTPHITDYEKLRAKWGRRESRIPWSRLQRRYPRDLVGAAREALAEDAAREEAAA